MKKILGTMMVLFLSSTAYAADYPAAYSVQQQPVQMTQNQLATVNPYVPQAYPVAPYYAPAQVIAQPVAQAPIQENTERKMDIMWMSNF